jgi:hypothetical protein
MSVIVTWHKHFSLYIDNVKHFPPENVFKGMNKVLKRVLKFFCTYDVIYIFYCIIFRVVDPDPDWIRIGSGFSDFVDPDPYWESGSRIRIGNPDPGSVLGIRIPDPDPGARKFRNFSRKMHFLIFFNKILPLKRYKIALTTF